MSNEIILYDLPSKAGTCWSLNPWKARLALNYKDVPYKTEWVEYPDIKPKFESTIGPNANGMSYTIPIVRFPSGETIMDSLSIARHLETLHPEPPLHLDNSPIERVQSIVQKMTVTMAPLGLPRIPKHVLNEASVPYFGSTREKRFGMPLAEVEKGEKAQNALENVKPHVKELAAVLNEDQSGPYVLGTRVSWSDFVIVGFFLFAKRLGDDLFDEFMKADEAFPKLYAACEKWTKRDDH